MTNPSPADPAPEELSPEARAIMARARRTFMVTMGLLLVGFIVIAGALVYRASQTGTKPVYAAEALRLPQGAEIVSGSAAGGEVTITYRVGPALQMRIFDGATGAMTSQFDIVSE
jgi:hypothetical protein